MPIYRVSYITDLLVDCADEREAERIGFDRLEDEVRNRGSEVFSVKLLEDPSQIRRWEHGSLPWRDESRHAEPELTVDQILEGTS